MANETTQTTTEKKKTTTKKAPNAGAKKKKTRKASQKTAARKYRLRPEERLAIKGRLESHFGKTKIATALENCKFKTDIDAVLLQWKKKLEQEIEEQEREVDDYYAEIDAEYRAVGRPKSIFNWREFDYLCSIGCTLEEIAGFFQILKSNLQSKVKDEYNETFSERYEKLSQGVKISIRRKQIKIALDGDTAMLKFLGKNVLGQKEKIDFDGEVKVNSWVDLVNNLDAPKPEENKDEKV